MRIVAQVAEDICETGPMVYSPYPRILESLAVPFADEITKAVLSPQLFEL